MIVIVSCWARASFDQESLESVIAQIMASGQSTVVPFSFRTDGLEVKGAIDEELMSEFNGTTLTTIKIEGTLSTSVSSRIPGDVNAFAGRRRQVRATCSTCGGPLLDDTLIGAYSHGWLVLMAMDAAPRKWHLSVLLTSDAPRSV